MNLSSRGSVVALGLPGTGLSYRHQLTIPNKRASQPNAKSPQTIPGRASLRKDLPSPELQPFLVPEESLANEIRSAEVATLTSPDLGDPKELINQATSQKCSLDSDLQSAVADRSKAWVKLRRREQMPLRPFYEKRLPSFRAAYDEAEGEALKVIEAMAISKVRVQFEFDAQTLAAQRKLEAAHGRLSRCARIWDVTSLNAIDRFATRSLASSAVTRKPVRLMSVTDGVIAGEQVGLRFQNANGGDLDFYPGFLLMRTRSSDDYALIDVREIDVDVRPLDFIEDESVPHDTAVVGQAWARSNKDGSPDRRFANNYRIPIVRYGRIDFRTDSGLAESYQVSDWEAASAFDVACREAHRAMRSQGGQPGAVPAAPPSEATTIDLDERLPPLPHVPGAHGFTVAALITVCMAITGAAFALQTRRQALPSQVAILVAPEPATNTQSPPTTETHLNLPLSAEPSVVAQQHPVAIPGPVQPSLPERERVMIKQTANVRSAPDRGAPVLKSVGSGVVLQVFARQRDRVQVGEDSPAGWVHGSLLKPTS